MQTIMTALLAITFIAVPVTQAQAQNKPCSGKMGGVAQCTKDDKFVCKNGKISQSRKHVVNIIRITTP